MTHVKVLNVSNCDQSMSAVRRSLSVVWHQQFALTDNSYTLGQFQLNFTGILPW